MDGEAPAERVDLHDYVRPLWSRLWLIVAIVAVVTGGTYWYYERQPEVYQASTKLYVAPSTLDQVLFGGNGPQDQATIDNLTVLLQTSAVAREAAKQIGYKGDPRALLGGVSAVTQGDSDFILVTGAASSPQKAAALANGFATGFIKLRADQVDKEADKALTAAEGELSRLGSGPASEPQRASLDAQIQQLRLIRSLPAGAGGSGIRQIEPAVPPSSPTEPNPGRNAIFAFVVSLVLGVGAALALDRFDRRIRRVEDVEKIYGLPVLTELPTVRTPAPVIDDEALIAEPFREPFRRLQTNLEMFSRARELRTIVVASAAPGEGKSIVARNLALAYREAGKRVAVVDADFRKPSLAGLLATDDGPGLANVLSGSSDLRHALQDVPVHATNGHHDEAVPVPAGASPEADPKPARPGALSLVTSGPQPANPGAALATGKMRDTLTSAALRFDAVIVDSPPVLAVGDALPLLSEADGVILVARLGTSTRDSADRLMAELKRLPDVNLLGVVANGIPARQHRNRAYGYGYSYGRS